MLSLEFVIKIYFEHNTIGTCIIYFVSIYYFDLIHFKTQIWLEMYNYVKPVVAEKFYSKLMGLLLTKTCYLFVFY